MSACTLDVNTRAHPRRDDMDMDLHLILTGGIVCAIIPEGCLRGMIESVMMLQMMIQML